MKRNDRNLWGAALVASAWLAFATATPAQPVQQAAATQPAPAPAADPIPGWDAYIDAVHALPARMLARLPESMRNDPQVRQEVAQMALQAFTSASIDALASDGDHPSFVPQIGQALDVGQPNADTNYRVARITPGGSYRIRGARGTLRIVNISQAPPSPGEPGFDPSTARAQRPQHDVNALHVDAHGRFDVLLSPTRPAGYRGDWWQLAPSTSKLLLRMVSSNWGQERDPTFSIERIDHPVERSRPSAAALEQSFRQASVAANFIAMLFIDHIEQLRSEGYVNKLKVLNPIGAMAGQFYYEGVYDLHDDEALIVEARAPAHCQYRSMILTDELYRTTDWTNNQSSLNDSQARVDRDGVLRVVVSARDPGVPNWLDTAGYPLGLVQGRWTNCDAQPVPTMRKVALAEVRAALPPETPTVTPAQREQIIRDRRNAAQQRPLW